MKKILLLGAGGHAESCIDLLSEQNIFVLSGICGKLNGSICGFKIR